MVSVAVVVNFAEEMQAFLPVNMVVLVVGMQMVCVAVRKGVDVIRNVKRIMG
jgi:hypothetical protein